MPQRSSRAVANLLTILDLEPLEQNLFRGRGPREGWQRVYGGQVLGQALVAAVRTVEERASLHSMHGYFLLARRSQPSPSSTRWSAFVTAAASPRGASRPSSMAA